MSPLAELESLGFLESGSAPGGLKHLDDVTDVVRRDVSSTVCLWARVSAGVRDIPWGPGRVACRDGRHPTGSGREERVVFVAPTLPTAQSRAVGPTSSRGVEMPGAGPSTGDSAAQTVGLTPPAVSWKVLN